MKNWFVVANASRARVLEAGDASGSLVHVSDRVHPESRLRSAVLGDDRPGHVEGTGHGLGSASYQPRSDPHHKAHLAFARELVAVLDEGVRQGRCAGLVLVASNPFLGELKSALGADLEARVLRTEPSDWTALDESELARRLQIG